MSKEYQLLGTNLNRQQLARTIGVTRMTLYTWLKNPDKMPLGAYKKLRALGLDNLLNQQVTVEKCEHCDGSGLVFNAASKDIKQRTLL